MEQATLLIDAPAVAPAKTDGRANSLTPHSWTHERGAIPTYLEFFAGSGLVAEALRSFFKPLWANDICEKKAAVYSANHGSKHFHLGSIGDVAGSDLPASDMAWASFPCQDLSLAGMIEGIHGARSGLVWQWLRVIDEMPRRPPVLIAENVAGLVSVEGGSHYRLLHKALVERGYKVDTVNTRRDQISTRKHCPPRRSSGRGRAAPLSFSSGYGP